MELICNIKSQGGIEMKPFWILRNLVTFVQEELRTEPEEEREGRGQKS